MDAIRTARLLIRPFRSGDIDDSLDYQSHPDVRRYLPGQPRTAAEAADYLSMVEVVSTRAGDRSFELGTLDLGGAW